MFRKREWLGDLPIFEIEKVLLFIFVVSVCSGRKKERLRPPLSSQQCASMFGGRSTCGSGTLSFVYRLSLEGSLCAVTQSSGSFQCTASMSYASSQLCASMPVGRNTGGGCMLLFECRLSPEDFVCAVMQGSGSFRYTARTSCASSRHNGGAITECSGTT